MIGEQIQHAEQAVAAMSFVGPVLAVLTPNCAQWPVLVSLAGAVALAVMTGIQNCVAVRCAHRQSD